MFGSVTDSAGTVPAGLVVEAYVGEKLCGKGATEFTGEGASRVTVYYADVVASTQTAGCGTAGGEVRIKVGDRFAPQNARWQKGPVQFDITFGSATPAPIPTFTPAPRPTATQRPPSNTAAAGSSEAAPTARPGTVPAGSPGAGSPFPTLRGGLTSSTPLPGQDSGDGGEGGFPVWAIVVVVLGGVALIGGGIGYAMSHGNPADDDLFGPPDS
jgi:hypothetical protein